MPRCPRCSKNFQDMSHVMNHMNQPSSSCLSYYEEVTRANATLPNPSLNILAGASSQELTDVPDNLMGTVTDADSPIMDIDNNHVRVRRVFSRVTLPRDVPWSCSNIRTCANFHGCIRCRSTCSQEATTPLLSVHIEGGMATGFVSALLRFEHERDR